MIKRFLSANASDILSYDSEQLKQSIKSSEGRIICSEIVVLREPYIPDITSAEVAKSFGADIILLNGFDLFNPVIMGMYKNQSLINPMPSDSVVNDLKELIGRPVGMNLEPVDDNTKTVSEKVEIVSGRKVSVETLKRANELGLNFICLTGNPGTGVTNQSIVNAIKLAKQHFNGLIFAGKMHGAGVAEKVIDESAIEQFIEAGADVILVPSVGTIQGVSEEDIKNAVEKAHAAGAMVMSAIGTSQETSSVSTIEYMSIKNKIAGVDIQHIGDAGPGGICSLENIYALSKAIRGQRHTVSLIARSIKR